MEPILNGGTANAHVVAVDIFGKTGLFFPRAPEVHVGVAQNQRAALIGAAIVGDVLLIECIHTGLEAAFVSLLLLTCKICFRSGAVCKDLQRQTFHRGSANIVAGELDGALRHGNTAGGIADLTIN